MLSDVVIDLDCQVMRLVRVPNVLDTGRRVRQDLIAHAMVIGVFDTDLVDVGDLLDMLFCIGGEETCPPTSLFLKARERKGFFEGDFPEHLVGLYQS